MREFVIAHTHRDWACVITERDAIGQLTSMTGGQVCDLLNNQQKEIQKLRAELAYKEGVIEGMDKCRRWVESGAKKIKATL